MKDNGNHENYIAAFFKNLPRKKVVFGQKEKVWLTIQNRIRNTRLARENKQRRSGLGFLNWSFFRRLRLQSLAVALIVLVAVSIVGGVARATPGEALYSVKRAAERVEKVLATNESAKAKIEIRHAKRRLAEVKTLVAENRNTQFVAQTLEDLTENTQKAAAVTGQNPELTSAVVDLANHEEAVLVDVHEVASVEVQEAILKALVATKETVDKLSPDESVQGLTSADGQELIDPSTAFDNPTATSTATTTLPDIAARKPVVKPKANDGAMGSDIQIDVITRIAEPEEEEEPEPTILPDPTIDF